MISDFGHHSAASGIKNTVQPAANDFWAYIQANEDYDNYQYNKRGAETTYKIIKATPGFIKDVAVDTYHFAKENPIKAAWYAGENAPVVGTGLTLLRTAYEWHAGDISIYAALGETALGFGGVITKGSKKAFTAAKSALKLTKVSATTAKNAKHVAFVEKLNHVSGPKMGSLDDLYFNVSSSGKRVGSVSKLSRKDQPWTIRPSQEWKSKIVGRAQKTGTRKQQSMTFNPHGDECYKIAIELAKNPDVEKVFLNQGIKKASGHPIQGSNRRPDVTYVTKDGKVHQFEVASKSDVRELLEMRMKETKTNLPKDMQGEVEVITYESYAK